jgi:hypothetical protein
MEAARMTVFRTIFLPCGSTAHFDESSGISYRCDSCFAVVGSIGQPDRCSEESAKWKTLKALGGKGWDYEKGRQEA